MNPINSEDKLWDFFKKDKKEPVKEINTDICKHCNSNNIEFNDKDIICKVCVCIYNNLIDSAIVV